MATSVEPGWLHTLGQIAGTLLLVELGLALFVILVFAAALAFGAWWLRHQALPVLYQYSTLARQALAVATRGTDRVMRGVAEFQGRKSAVETALRVLLFGRSAVRPEAKASAAAAHGDLRDRTTPPGISADEGFAPEDLPADPMRGADARGASPPVEALSRAD